jgi:hypothetical protein
VIRGDLVGVCSASAGQTPRSFGGGFVHARSLALQFREGRPLPFSTHGVRAPLAMRHVRSNVIHKMVAGGQLSEVAVGTPLDLVCELPADGVLRLFGELCDESGGSGDQDEAAHAPRWDADVDEGGSPGTGAVDRQLTPGLLLVLVGDELEEPEVHTEEMFLGHELVEARHSRVLSAVERMSEAGDALAGSNSSLHCSLGDAS